MKKVRIGFAALIALAAMSFTIASHSKVFNKRVDIPNCYKVKTTAKYLSSCSSPAVFTEIDCSNKASAIGKALKNDLSLGTFVSTFTCEGGNTFCCINLKTQSTDPCGFTTLEQKGNGTLKDFNGNVIAASDFVIVNDIQCKQP